VAALPYPHPTTEAASRVMRGNRKRDTRPEVLLRSELHRRGLRFRKDYLIREAGLRVRADIAFPRRRIAVFLDGCFWHGCPKHGNVPRANSRYWSVKLARNHERDGMVNSQLRAAGWCVIRVWEHTDPAEAAAHVQEALEVPS
jgi:DNA mismatch endonuclease (patch repair protein)